MLARRKSGKKKARREAKRPARKAPKSAARSSAKKRILSRAKTRVARKIAKKPAARKIVAKGNRRPAIRSAPTPPAPRHPLGFLELHVSFNTRAYEGLASFFRDRIGLPAQAMDEMGYVNIDVCRGGSLGFMRWSPPEDPEGGSPGAFAAAEAGLYVMCEDVAFVYQALLDRGVRFEGPPSDQPWGHRTIRTSDPEGRSLVFAQAIHR